MKAQFIQNVRAAAQTEQLRQARIDFNLYCIGFGTSLIVGAIGSGMVLSGQTTEGAFTAVTGAGISAMCIQKKHDAEDKLEQLIAGTNVE